MSSRNGYGGARSSGADDGRRAPMDARTDHDDNSIGTPMSSSPARRHPSPSRSPPRARSMLAEFFRDTIPARTKVEPTLRNWADLFGNGQYRDCLTVARQFLSPGAVDRDPAAASAALEFAVRSMVRLNSRDLGAPRELLTKYPSLVRASPHLAILDAELRDPADRITVLENMLSENPDHDDAVRHALIDAYLHAGTATAAVAMLTSMERVPPLRRSQVLLRAGRLQAALAVLQDVPPVPADIQIQISVCLIRQDRFAEAIDALNRIVAQGDDLTAAVNLSCALLYTNKSAKSIEVLEERLRRDPGRVVRHTEAFAMLNTLYEMTRDNPTREQEVLISIAQEYGPQVPLPHGLDYA